MIEPLPLRDVLRLVASPDIEVLTGIESRVILLGFDHASDTPALADGRRQPAR